MHRCADAQMRGGTDAQGLRGTEAQRHRCSGAKGGMLAFNSHFDFLRVSICIKNSINRNVSGILKHFKNNYVGKYSHRQYPKVFVNKSKVRVCLKGSKTIVQLFSEIHTGLEALTKIIGNRFLNIPVSFFLNT